MNPTAQKVGERLMNQAMPCQRRLSGKCRTDNEQTDMPTAAAGAFVARMPRRVVDQFEALRRERGEALANLRLQLLTNAHAGFTHAGRAFLKGFTVTCA